MILVSFLYIHYDTLSPHTEIEFQKTNKHQQQQQKKTYFLIYIIVLQFQILVLIIRETTLTELNS